MAQFTIQEILEATGGALLAGKLSGKVSGVSTDTRLIKNRQLFVAIKGDTFDGHDFLYQASLKGATAFLVQRKDIDFPVGKDVVWVDDTIKAFGRLARYHRTRFNIPLIAVTGSAGKTSTKELLAAVMRRRYHVLYNKGTENNHMGVPQTLLKLTKRHKMAVIEMGTNHPGEIAWLAENACPTVAVFTNVGASHLEGLKDLEGVFQEKSAILQYLPKNGCVVLNADDPYWARLLKQRLPQKVVSYGLESKADLTARDITAVASGISFKVDMKMPLVVRSPSVGAVYNALAAIACGRYFKVKDDDISRALRRARPAKGRQCWVKSRGITFIDDTYNANPVSYKNAIVTLKMLKNKGRSVLVASDMLELGKDALKLHQEVGQMVAAANVDAVFTFGQNALLIGKAAQRAGVGFVATAFDQTALAQAVLGYLRSGDVVLFKGSRGMRMEKVFETCLKG